MIKKILIILLLFILVSNYQESFAQGASLGARVWTVIARQQVGETVIRRFNSFQDSIARLTNNEAPEPVPEDRPLIITAKQNFLGSEINNEILKIDWFKEIQSKDGSIKQIKKIADAKDGPKPSEFLSKDLYDRIAKRNYFWEEDEYGLSSGVTLINAGRCRDVYWWTPRKYELSVYQIIARVTDKWGGEFRIGDDELGLPFWTAGIFKVGLNHQVIKVFFQGPLGMGKTEGSLLKGRLLEGGMGGGIYFDIDNFGGRVSFSDITKKADNFLDDKLNDAVHYYIPFAVQGYYTFTIPVVYEKFSGSLRIKAGAGYHQVLPVKLIPGTDNRLEPVNNDIDKRQHKVSPFLRFDYALKDESAEGFVQFYNMSLLVGAGYNFTEWFGLEAKLSFWDLVRAKDKWEPSFFVMISPRIRF